MFYNKITNNYTVIIELIYPQHSLLHLACIKSTYIYIYIYIYFSICEMGKFNCSGDPCPPFECDFGYMRCGQLEMCVPEVEVCDGYYQCPNGTDEANCGKLLC